MSTKDSSTDNNGNKDRATHQMRLYVAPEPLILALREYLVKRPYGEVCDFIMAIDNLQIATIRPDK